MAVIVVLALASSDVASVLAAASRAQTAADAAALAAAQELALPGGTAPSTAAQEFAARNGAQLLWCNCAPGAADAVVEVRASVGRLLLFGGGRTVTARARAVVDRGGGAS
jgi:Flp pilus assembly protein TadG